MAKVIIFSEKFMKSHPKCGENTFFTQKYLTGLYVSKQISKRAANYWKILDRKGRIQFLPKLHTIRAGKKWKKGDLYSPRIWSGLPYRSKQIVLCSDKMIFKTYDFDYHKDSGFYLNGVNIDIGMTFINENDGLSKKDFFDWFTVNEHFSGQILCFSKGFNYEVLTQKDSPVRISNKKDYYMNNHSHFDCD